MIKMYIDNEEVVCNKEFTIKEEMLSTSSTILNNCYPKSWEQDHDYVSRFYYPKDYSKCLIYNKNDEIYQNYQILGICIQDGIPTPTTPIEIETITENVTKIINNKTYNFSLGNIELCKIGNYQDYIYYNNGWYIHKEVGKYILDTNQITLRTSYSNLEYAVFPKATDFVGYNKYGQYFTFCNKAISRDPVGGWNSVSNIDILLSGAERYNWWIGFEKNTGLDNIKTLLENTIIYYPLTTATDELITDENLLKQLNFVGNELLFSGMVKNSGDISLNPRYPKYCNLEILDFKDFLSTGETLDFVINEKTISEAISMVVDTVSQYGFILGNINILNPNEVIGAYSTENKSAYDVLQYLADISESRWTTRMIDENTIAIDFYDPTLMPSGIDIDYTNEWWCNNKVIDLSFNYGTRDYRNKQVMLSDEVYGGVDYDETILANGYDKTFLTTTKIGIVNAIYVEGVVKTFATNEEKELGIEADFYYTPGENTFNCNENDSYSAGTQIVINYTPLVRGREVILNSDEISRINANTGRKGIVARYETRNDVLSSNELKMVGETYIKYKGTAEIIINLSTQADIYNVGQTVYFDAPIDELSTDYMVKSKSTEIIATTGDVFYTYELTSSFNSESVINWFDNQRNKTTGNITMGQSINRNIDVEATANIIWDTLTITEVTVTGDNVLNSPLNSPFVE